MQMEARVRECTSVPVLSGWVYALWTRWPGLCAGDFGTLFGVFVLCLLRHLAVLLLSLAKVFGWAQLCTFYVLERFAQRIEFEVAHSFFGGGSQPATEFLAGPASPHMSGPVTPIASGYVHSPTSPSATLGWLCAGVVAFRRT